MSQLVLPYVTIYYQEPIVFFEYKSGTELGFPEIRELIACAEKLSHKRPYVTYSDVTVEMNITEEGKRYLSNLQNMPYFRGTAVLVKNNMYKFAANFLNNFNKKPYPFKAFTKKEKAISWLMSLPLEPDAS